MLKTINYEGKDYQIDAELLLKLVNKEEVASDIIEEKLTGWERVDILYDYYSNNMFDEQIDNVEGHDTLSDINYEKANYFSLESKAQEIADKELLYRQMCRFRDMNDRDYKGGFSGYAIICDEDMSLQSVQQLSVGIHDVVFTTKELCDLCLSEFKDDILKIWEGK